MIRGWSTLPATRCNMRLQQTAPHAHILCRYMTRGWSSKTAGHCNTLTATHCNALQHTDCNTLQHTATHTHTFYVDEWRKDAAQRLQHTAAHTHILCRRKTRGCSILTATHCDAMTATHCNTHTHTHTLYVDEWRKDGAPRLQHTHCNTLQHTHILCRRKTRGWSTLNATHCNTLHRTATHWLQHTATHTHTFYADEWREDGAH